MWGKFIQEVKIEVEENVIATDINEKPLQSAQKNLEKILKMGLTNGMRSVRM